MFGLPLNDPRFSMVSDLLEMPGIKNNVDGIIVFDNGSFKLVTQKGDDGDHALRAGETFALVAKQTELLAFRGMPWQSNDAAAAPSSQRALPFSLEEIEKELRKIGVILQSEVDNAPAVGPSKTALMQNYPNPFNPETWIPFDLKRDSEVSLSIFDSRGNLIRLIPVGYTKKGSYRQKNDAIYWNGQNEQGERVTSGVYFYTLHTQDGQFTKKMLVIK